jgi:hypothetical protein
MKSIGAVLICLASCATAHAELVSLEIQSKKPWLGGNYEKLQGKAHFAIDPKSAVNQRIADISYAPVNAQGKVEFTSDFIIVRPADSKKSRHAALIEVPNRGSTQANGFFFSTTPGSGFDLMKLDSVALNDSFLFDEGFTVAWLGWEADLEAGEIGATLPRATVNSVVRESQIAQRPQRSWALGGRNSYCAADTDQPNAKLIVRFHIDEAGEELPRSAFAFVDSKGGAATPNPCFVTLREPTTPGRIYDLMYQGSNPAIAGLGLAAFRDLASYLKREGSVSRVLGYGYSQSGRFLRDFLCRGFNEDEQGKLAFDGLFIASAGAGRGSFDHRYAMPGVAGNSVLSITRPVDLPPFDDEGLLAVAARSQTLPRIFYTYSSTEYWARFGSLAYTTTNSAKELPLNPNSRLYFISGTPHSGAPFPPSKNGRGNQWSNFANYARATWAFRALLLDLDEWTAKGTKPPDSVYPHLADGLARRSDVKFPHIPGAEFPSWMPRIWRLDFGPEYATKGVINTEPPKLGEQFTVLVPRVKPDGNDIGGIELPEVAVPLGTFTGWNYALPVLLNLDYLAGLFGSFIPFAKTAEERKVSGDERLSIEERYPNKDAYMKQITETANALVTRRLMRAEDMNAAHAQASSRWDYLTAKP